MSHYPQRIIVMGPSGSGTSTLGRLLSIHLRVPYLDSDDFVWIMHPEPYCRLRAPEHRAHLLRYRLEKLDSWIIGGAVCGWGDEIIPALQCAIFLSTPATICTRRMQQRDSLQFGRRILPGGDLHEIHNTFIENTANYQTNLSHYRGRARHEDWLAKLRCRIIRLDGIESPDHLLSRLSEQLQD